MRKQLNKIANSKLAVLLNKNPYLSHLFILVFGLLAYFLEYYLLTCYTLVHFFVLFLKSFSKTFDRRLEIYQKDQLTIKTHYLEDFKIFYYLVLIVRMITGLFYLYFFSLEKEDLNNYADLFYGLTYLFIVISFLDLIITIYIIFYKNPNGK